MTITQITAGVSGYPTTEFRLLNEFQRDLPLCHQPFARIAESIGSDEQTVIATLELLQAAGRVSRVGAVFAPRRIGVSTLAAMAVPATRLAEVAALVNGFAEVNHNYEREHCYNLWFVATASSPTRLAACLAAIERLSGLAVMRLPLEEEYHIDLGFALNRVHGPRDMGRPRASPDRSLRDQRPVVLTGAEERLAGVLQQGLPMIATPFLAVADSVGLSEAEVLRRIETWQDEGVIKRFGVVVRHRELGYVANAMVVQDIPDDRVGEVGRRLAGESAVTLCYRRPRMLPDWPYNLFCMIHGQAREEVEATVNSLRREHGLDVFPHAVLFSRTRFKQRGARYVELPGTERRCA